MARTTALITGASSGFGEQFARLFARDGHDVVLVARSAAALDRLGAELERLHGIKARALPVDLRAPGAGSALFDAVTAAGVEVDFLVNNAGFGSTGGFLELPLAEELAMVQVNCAAVLELSHRFGAAMAARGRGRILNVGSTAGFQPGPYMATYYATKAFVVSFSEALAHELQGSGVTVTCACPGAARTGFAARSGNEKNKLFQQPGLPSAAAVAEDAYEAMMQGEVVAVHGLLNWLGVEAVRFGPRAVVRAVTAALNRP